MLTEKLAKQCGWRENGRYDAVVVGAGPAGVGAAIAAARKGLRVALIESCGFTGGVATKSCVPLYFGFGVDDKQSTAGLSEEFIRRMDEVGAASFIAAKDCAYPEFRPIAGRPLTKKIQLHPETMKLMYRRMLEEAKVECVFYAQMVDAVTEGDWIAAWSKSADGFSAVPMGALISPHLSNALAAGRGISADPRTVATFRMMNTCMTLGEAAGLMASLGGDMRKLEYARLRPELDDAGFILEDK